MTARATLLSLALVSLASGGLAAAPKSTAPDPQPKPAASTVPSVAATPVQAADPDPVFIPEAARRAAVEGSQAFAKKDFAGAQQSFRKVLDLAPDNLVALVNLGVTEFALGNSDESEKLLKKAVRKRLETAPAWLTLGILYMDQGKLDEALAALTQAVLYDSGNPRAHNYLGVVIGRKGWNSGAESELRRAIEIDPNYTDANYNLAVFYLGRRPPAIELARRHYVRAIELGAAPDPQIEQILKDATPQASASPQKPQSSPSPSVAAGAGPSASASPSPSTSPSASASPSPTASATPSPTAPPSHKPKTKKP